jgi:hypothetical protein
MMTLLILGLHPAHWAVAEHVFQPFVRISGRRRRFLRRLLDGLLSGGGVAGLGLLGSDDSLGGGLSGSLGGGGGLLDLGLDDSGGGCMRDRLNHYRQSKKGQSTLRRTVTEGKLAQRRRHARDLHAAAPPPALIPARSD